MVASEYEMNPGGYTSKTSANADTVGEASHSFHRESVGLILNWGQELWRNPDVFTVNHG